jgi:hypothetical protein
MFSNIDPLTTKTGFDLLGAELGIDVAAALQSALAGGAVFARSNDPLGIFRTALSNSIRNIESHPRGKLFQDFLAKGPYELSGAIPPDLIDKRLSDQQTAEVIKFVYSFMINSFKGEVTELLAASACMHLLDDLKRSGRLPAGARLYIGDAVKVKRKRGNGFLKGADLSILIEGDTPHERQFVSLAGVAEVKSYFRSENRLREQLDQHIRRSKHGLCVAGKDYPGESIRIGFGSRQQVIKISVRPDDWHLPRTYHFDTYGDQRLLYTDDGVPTKAEDLITQTGEDEWTVTLRWSKEALTSAAYEMTFWYMAQVGETSYSKDMPKEWGDMIPAEAGRNAAKMMLYYAILRCNTARENQRAIALYNTYGFGYALGMNFINGDGKREMLWLEDLDEILLSGKTKHGCRIKAY